MNNIQKLISELEARSKSHKYKVSKYYKPYNKDADYFIGRSNECDFVIHKLTLLLNDESKQPQPPDFANTVLGEVPQVVNSGTEENSKAVEGATPVVRQNEQTKEVYPNRKCSICGTTKVVRQDGYGCPSCG